MAQISDEELERELQLAFRPHINPGAPRVARVLRAAFDHATVRAIQGASIAGKTIPKAGSRHWEDFIATQDLQFSQGGGREIVIDKTALFFGVVADGLRSGDSSSSSVWLVEWLRQGGGRPDTIFQGVRRHSDSVESARAAGARIVASSSLRQSILPAAVELARKTAKKDQAELHHIIFALIEDEQLLVRSNFRLAPHQVFQLRSYLVNRIAESPEMSENMEAWQEHLGVAPDAGAKGETAAANPPLAESVPTLSDAPTKRDELGRQAFADVLAARIRDVESSLSEEQGGGDAAFIIHLDGAWGAGKSSLLNLIKQKLEDEPPKWLVVEVNAWRFQDCSPPWWPLITSLHSAAVRDLKWYEFPAVRRIWLSWRWRAHWFPIFMSLLLVLVLVVFGLRLMAASEGSAPSLPRLIADIAGALLALVGLAGLALGAGRRWLVGSDNAVETLLRRKDQPFQAAIDLHRRLVNSLGHPVAVFLDDLDRCESGYVVNLLQSIQTLLRSAPIVYVVAADRKWICSSFEKRYAEFGAEIGTAGRPLGYLFLDKVFQLSVSIPRLSKRYQDVYWRRLLRSTGRSGGQDRRILETKARRDLEGKIRSEDIQAVIDEAPRGSLEREILQAEAAKAITTAEAAAETEHRLQPLSRLLEPNPRAMKRLVNAYGLNQARAFLEDRKIDAETLARWTIIELRWPRLADYLSNTRWADVGEARADMATFPAHIAELLESAEVRDVLGREQEPGALTVQSLREILD